MIALDVTRIRFRRSDTDRARTPDHMDHMVSMIYFQQTAWDGNENHPETVRTGIGHAKEVYPSYSRNHLIKDWLLRARSPWLAQAHFLRRRQSRSPKSIRCPLTCRCAIANLDLTCTTWSDYVILQSFDYTCVMNMLEKSSRT